MEGPPESGHAIAPPWCIFLPPQAQDRAVRLTYAGTEVSPDSQSFRDTSGCESGGYASIFSKISGGKMSGGGKHMQRGGG